MSSPDVVQAMLEVEIGREIIGLVPHWYQSECGPVEYSIPVGTHTARFYNHCRLTPRLGDLLERITSRTQELPLAHFVRLPSLTDVLLESFAIEWLRIHSAAADWTTLLKYLETLARRTYENTPVTLNMIIRAGQGTGEITHPHFQKFLDRLATSPLSFLVVDPELRLIEYGEVDWTQIKRASSCKFYPDALHPIHSIMEEGDLSAHLSVQGDFIVMNKAGILTARRRRKWKLYDVETLKDSLAYCLGSRNVGTNLFDVVFDLSLRRQGALLVYDPEHHLHEHVLNRESIIFPGWQRTGETRSGLDCGQALIAPSVQDIAIGQELGTLKKRRRLIELACADGAVIFDDDHLLALGALIQSHPNVGSQLGARTTAARSAYLWGGHPVKVSSDGDVTVYFRSANGRRQCDAVMSFL